MFPLAYFPLHTVCSCSVTCYKVHITVNVYLRETGAAYVIFSPWSPGRILVPLPLFAVHWVYHGNTLRDFPQS